MSLVTNTILTFSILEYEKDRINDVNKFFEESGFVSCDDESLPIGWYGGTKMLETNVAIGAFNYLELEEFIEHLRNIKWEEPQNVQIIVKEQNDEKFRLLDLTNTL